MHCCVADRTSDSITRIGVGGIVPKDIEDGSFTSRIRTSDDKLLQQLIGKKKAKAHIHAKQEAARPNAASKAQHYKKLAAKKEESDDDEEGRAATFKSKRQKKKVKQEAKPADSDDEDEETRAKRLEGGTVKVEEELPKEEVATDAKQTQNPSRRRMKKKQKHNQHPRKRGRNPRASSTRF